MPDWVLLPCGRQEGNARAVSVMGELALPVWFHLVSLAAIRPTGDWKVGVGSSLKDDLVVTIAMFVCIIFFSLIRKKSFRSMTRPACK